jgi:drug/metabolite transporter (DMT)-like permease
MAIVYLVWGSTYLALDVAITTMPPMLMMSLRFAIAGGALYVWAVRRGGRRERPTRRQWLHTLVTGGTMLVGGTGLISLAMVWIGAGTAALLSATVPVWLALFARIVHRDRLSRMSWIGLMVGLVGVAVLVDPSGGQLPGMVLAILGAMAWAGGSLRSRVAPAPSRPLVAASMEMLGASVVFLLVGILLGEPARLDLAAIDLPSILSFVYLTTAGSIVAFTAYRWLLMNAPTPLVGTHAYVNPIVAVLLAWAVLGERLEGRALVAGGVILLSVLLVVTARRHEPVPAQATSGGDVFAGSRRWRRVGRRLGRLPARARILAWPWTSNHRAILLDRPKGRSVDDLASPPLVARRDLRRPRGGGPMDGGRRAVGHRQARGGRRGQDRRVRRRG